MNIIKQGVCSRAEMTGLIFIYVLLFVNAFFLKDTPAAVLSAFFGITYTMMAGKGSPVCYLFGVSGSAFYSYLAFHNALWGNLILYMGYYIPMQILGFFQWQKNLKQGKYEIIKTSLTRKQACKAAIITLLAALILIVVLIYLHDKSPYIDGITTIFSIAGMYLTVKRCIEQWIVWMIVNGLSLIMWLQIAFDGAKVYSTVIMWSVYFLLAIYFYVMWKRDLSGTRELHQHDR